MDESVDLTLQIIANFTHQVINPINGIIGTIDNLLDETIPKEKQQQRLNSVRGQLEVVVTLIRNMAYFAQYSAKQYNSKDPVASSICIIPQVIIEAAQFYQEAGAHNGIRIELLNKSDQNAVRGNPDLLRQVFMNMFDNGIKYGYKQSVIEVKNWIQKGSHDLIVEIRNQGIGFDSEEDIFGLGKRGKEALSHTSAGSGLGLHICKMIVEKVFNGTIRAQHIYNSHQTIFELRIPDAFDNERRK